MPKRLTRDEFIEQLAKEHPELELLSDYNGNKNYVTVRCKKHDYTFKTKPNWLHKGTGCQKCYDDRRGEAHRKSLEQVINEFRQVHGNKYDYSLITEYKNNSQKLPIICHEKDENGNEHGIFYQTANKHFISKHGCPKCANELNGKRKRLTTEQFIERAKAIHGDKYDYSKTKYVDYETPLTIICPVHGEFQQTPEAHLAHCGCPICNSSHLEDEMRQFLKKNHILFIEQKKFEWLGRQSLDFYLPRFHVGIECQGGQHFKEVEHFGDKEGFKKRLELDKRKNELCKENSVSLIYYIDENYKDKLNEISIYNDKNCIMENKIGQLTTVLKA